MIRDTQLVIYELKHSKPMAIINIYAYVIWRDRIN